MKLKSVQIKNYRSVEDVKFEIKQIPDQSFTYGLVGINESGKTSILKAIALKDKIIIPNLDDFTSSTIEIIFEYEISKEASREISNNMESVKTSLDPEIFTGKILLHSILINKSSPATVVSSATVLKSGELDVIGDIMLGNILDNFFLKTIYWTSDDEHLISKPINLTTFKSNPNSSLPLKNCFDLAGIDPVEAIPLMLEDVAKEIFYGKKLNKAVTSHINTIWPEHEVKIEFGISNSFIEFFVIDKSDEEETPMRTSQRSDGFRQFISFLLSVSAQDSNNSINNTILLLDEPEVHLHPKAQESLLLDLIKITKNDRNNIVFFSTHSNYMLDKVNISRNYKILKQKKKTVKEEIPVSGSTYAEVNYDIFDIPTVDYFNQLYGILHTQYEAADPLDTSRCSIKNFDQNYIFVQLNPIHKDVKKDKDWKGYPNEITFITEIRNTINHFDPVKTNQVDEKELRKAIKYLKELL